MTRSRLAGLLAALPVVAAGCGDEPTVAPVPTYHADVQPLVEQHCVACHAEGGIGPFRLDEPARLQDAAELALREIDAGRMPPWMPAPDCRPLRNERRLTDAEKDTFRRWVEGGMPLGDPADAPSAGDEAPAFEPTHALTIGAPYVPDAGSDDDYRCFVLDVEVDRDLYLRGTRVRPDADALVHHVLLYAVDPAQREAVEAADAADPGPGYTCFGSPLPGDGSGGDGLVDAIAEGGFGLPQTLAGWVPGMLPDVADPGVATRIAAGTPLVVQMHYNLLTADPEPDETGIDLILTDEPPEVLSVTRPAPILDLDIPAGATGVRHALDFVNHGAEPMRIGGFIAHMHLLGASFRTTVLREDGGEECLLDIPDWDFDWQQGYDLPADAPVTLAPGDGFRLECVHDNGREDQPIVAGERLPPEDVAWGDGSLDEMCLLYFEELRPYAPPPAPVDRCATAPACLDACDGPSDTACLLGCEALDFPCAVCALEGFVDCAVDGCALPLLSAQACLVECAQNSLLVAGSVGACMEARCPEAYAGVTACLDDAAATPACVASLGACGLSVD